MDRDCPRLGGSRHYLFAMYGGGGDGQVSLILPIARRLVERGHQVRILAGPSVLSDRQQLSGWFLDRIHAVGATPVRFQEPATHPFDATRTPPELRHRWMPRPFARAAVIARCYRWSSAWAMNVTTELRRSPADVLVVDHLLPGALAAAEAAHIPAAVLVHGIYKHRPAPGLPAYGTGFLPARGPVATLRASLYTAALRHVFQRDALPALNFARHQLGLPPLCSPFDQYDRARRVLVLTSAAFDFTAHHLPSNVRYVGSPFDDADTPAWDLPWAPNDPRPLVLTSLSTGQQGQGPLLQRILAALAELPVRGLVTLGPSLDPTRFHAAPNIVLEQFVPHAAVLPRADTLITQCGAATVMKALTHGVPMVCIPLVGDQPDNAARVAALGAGVRLGADASAARIRRAVQRVLAEPSYRGRAREFARLVATEDGTRTATAELEAL